MKQLNVTPYIKFFSAIVFIMLTVTITSCTDDSNSVISDKAELAVYDIINYEANDRITKSNKPGKDPIAAIAIAGGFSELVDALSYVDEELDAGLVNMFLNGRDQHTVFAPNDMAFNNLYEALGISTIRDLPADLVLNVLLYHVTEGRRTAKSVVPKKNPKTIETLLGYDFQVNKDGSITAIGNTASIIAADISASNGIIHVIDTVILPIK